jgi:ubiquinol-cytochrome c reductase cytochrome c1 subunit
MTKFRASFLATLALAALIAPLFALAAEEGEMASAQVDLRDKAALQHGAALYMNYCSGCHSLNYQRYSRTAKDLGLTDAQMQDNLVFSGARLGETMSTGMNPDDAGKWLGKAPPDLSVEARTKEQGPDWIYNYLKSFYVDEARPLGWNNTVFPGAGMPNVLWEMQGVQHALTKPIEGEGCEHGEFQGGCITGFTIPEAQKGSVSPEEFDKDARDISAFLAYVGEPAAMDRESLGVWVVLFLAFFTFIAYLLKSEYWRDVH